MAADLAPLPSPVATVTHGRRLPWATISIVGLFVIGAIFAPALTEHDPYTTSLARRLLPPSVDHPLGTDGLGRDVYARLLFGSRSTLLVVLTGLGAGAVIGIGLGIVAGYFRGVADTIISRAIDAMLAFPAIFFGLILVVTIGAGFGSVILAVSLVLWARFARVIRGEVMAVREEDYISQLQVCGCSRLRILTVHVAPNVLSPAMVLISINMGYVILLESILSYLGAGIPAPIPSWGGMIADGQSFIGVAWWMSVFPGLAIVLVVLSFNLLGDWMRDRLDPKRESGR